MEEKQTEALNFESTEATEGQNGDRKVRPDEHLSVLGFLSFLAIVGYIVLTLASSGTDGLQLIDARDGGVSGSITKSEIVTLP